MSSARVVRCWVTSRNERQPYGQLLRKRTEAAKEDFDRCIALDYNHQKSRWYRGMCKEINEKDS